MKRTSKEIVSERVANGIERIAEEDLAPIFFERFFLAACRPAKSWGRRKLSLLRYLLRYL